MKKEKKSPVKVNSTKSQVSLFHPNRKYFWFILIPCLIYLVYYSVTDYKLVNWDDKRYLLETPMIKGLTVENVKQMFSEKVLRSYNPLVLLSFAADFEISNLKPEWCHGVNLFFHILNALLVFACIKKLNFSVKAAGVIALLFGLHPLSVEAVAWIAGRKDMLYGFFYLLAWLSYLHFIQSRKLYQYFLCILLFILSLLSKVQAITFPFILIISDYILSSEFKWKSLINKIPFLLLAFIFGLVAVSGSDMIASKYNAIPTFSEKFVYSIMGFGLYIQKLIIPLYQSAIYSFPENGSSEYYKLLITGSAMILLTFFLIYKNIKAEKKVAGGLMFYVVSISVVLHLVAFNSALIYERFTYLASIGFFISIMCLDRFYPSIKNYAIQVLVPVILLFGYLTYSHAKVWRNGESLWSDVIEKNPRAAEAYNNRGMIYLEKGEYDLALNDFNESIRLKPEHPDSYNNRSVVYFNMKNYDEALKNNAVVLRIDSNHLQGMSNRGCFFFNMEQYDSAIYYYNYEGKHRPGNASAFFYAATGYFYTKKYPEALSNYKTALNINPRYADALAFMSATYAEMGEFDSAMIIVNKVEGMYPGSTARKMVSDAFIKKGSVSYSKGLSDSALYFYELARNAMPQNAQAYYNIGGIYLSKQNVSGARENWKKALAIDPNHKEAREWLQKIGEN